MAPNRIVKLQLEWIIRQFAENDTSFLPECLSGGRRSLNLDGRKAGGPAPRRIVKESAFKMAKLTFDAPPGQLLSEK